jgi:hypothetical protein
MIPSISLERAERFMWPELKAWHETALEVYRKMRGIS